MVSFNITITSRLSLYTVKNPIGVPQIERIDKRADEAILTIYEEDRMTGDDLSLDEVARGDIVEVKLTDIEDSGLNDDTIFFGEVISKEWERQQGLDRMKIIAHDFTRLASEVQLDRFVFNGYTDLRDVEIDDSFESDLLFGIKPLAAAQIFNPHGNFNISDGLVVAANTNEIHNIAFGTDRQLAILFNARSTTVKRLWFAMWDPADNSPFGNALDVRNRIQVAIQTVSKDSNDIEIPSGTLVTGGNGGLRSGGDTEFDIENDFKENWTGTTILINHGTVVNGPFLVGDVIEGSSTGDRARVSLVGVGSIFVDLLGIAGNFFGPFSVADDLTVIGGGPGITKAPYLSTVTSSQQSGSITDSDFVWDVDDGAGGAATGASNVEIIDSTVSSPIVGRGRAGRMNFDGSPSGSNVRIQADVSSFTLGDSGWLAIEIRPNQTSTTGRITIFADHGGVPKELAEIIFKFGGDFQLRSNTGTQTLFTYTADRHVVYLRIDIEKLRFDLFTAVGLFDTKRGVDFEFIDKAGFTEIPTQLSEIHVEVDDDGSGSTTGSFDVGWVTGGEIASFGVNYGADSPTSAFRYAQIDLGDDLLDLNPGQRYALVLSQPVSTLTQDRIFLGTFDPNNTDQGFSTEFGYRFTTDGSTTWDVLAFSGVEAQPAFFIEYTDSFVDVVEGRDFSVNFVDKKVRWSRSSSLTNRIKTSSYESVGSAGPHSMKFTARVSEYSNESSNTDGIVVDSDKGGVHSGAYTTHSMTLYDLVLYFNSFVDTNALGVGVGWSSTPIIDGVTAPDDSLTASIHDDTIFKVDNFMVTQRSVLEALRDLASQYGFTLSLSASSSKQLTFEALTTITDFGTTPTAANHEYMATTTDEFDDSFHRIKTNEMGRVSEEVYTTFPVKGATSDLQFKFINVPFAEDLGREIERDVEVFPKEVSIDNLQLYAQYLNDLYGTDVFEGRVTVSGFFPVFENRLDTNGIVRIIDSVIENGGDTSGIDNVFKIHSLLYDGETHTTEMFLSNRSVKRDELLRQIEEQRSFMRGIDPSNTIIEIHRKVSITAPKVDWSTGRPVVYAMLFDGNGDEISTFGYFRPIVDQYVRTIDGRTFTAFTAFFDTGNGTIPNDRKPIEAINFTEFATVGSPIISGSIDIALRFKPVYKWNNVSLHITFWGEHP